MPRSRRACRCRTADAAKRRQLFSALKQIYDTVAHGSAKAQKNLTARVVDELVEILRQLLCIVLKQGVSGKEWKNQIENIVFFAEVRDRPGDGSSA